MAIFLLLASPAVGNDSRLQPLRSQGELLAREIYDVTRWTLRVPYDLAYPYLVRFKLDPYIDSLPLDDAVRGRVKAHVNSREFVDEVIPFLIAVQETYSPRPGVDGFDAHLRRHYAASASVPGIEHSMFQWQASEDKGAAPALDKTLAARLVTLYDALYLRDANGGGFGDRLSCGAPATDGKFLQTVERARPLVRELFEDLAHRFEDQPEISKAAAGVARDPDKLEAVTVSIIDVTNYEVCKHYRVFATRVFREQQLRDWMLVQLERPGGGDLWKALEFANERRPYAVHVVVDGLQGHLVEALARGDAADPFVQAIAAEQARADKVRPPTQASRPGPAQSTLFLDHLARHGYHDANYLPFFRRLRGENGIARVGVSTTPTISVRNVPIALTGAPVAGKGSTGLPNFHYVERDFSLDGVEQGRAYYFYGNDAVLLDSLTHQSGMRTIVERLPWLSSFNCGSQYDDGAHFTVDGFVNLGIGEKKRDFGEFLCLPELERRAANEAELRALRQHLLGMREVLTDQPSWYEWYDNIGRLSEKELAKKRIARIAELEQETLPEYLVYYNPWPDHFAHFKGPFSDEIISPSGELNRLDFWLGRVAAIYENAGVADRTLFAMAGDHGLTPVFHMLNPEVEVFEPMRRRGLDVRVLKISSDEGEGPKLTNRLRPPSVKGYDVVVASTAGGNYMMDFFVDQGAQWARQPLAADLQALRLVSGQGPVNVIDEIYGSLHESLDYLVVRETPCGVEGGTVHLVGERGGQRAEGWIERRGQRVFYRYRGADLLETDAPSRYETLSAEQRAEQRTLHARCVHAARADDEATWCSEAAWRRLTSYSNRPDSVVQLAHLYDLDIAGTVNLFPRQGLGYNTIVPGRHAGESFHEKDAFAGIWGAPAAKRPERLRSAVNGSVPMAVYEYLTGTTVRQGEDGWGYPSLGAGD